MVSSPTPDSIENTSVSYNWAAEDRVASGQCRPPRKMPGPELSVTGLNRDLEFPFQTLKWWGWGDKQFQPDGVRTLFILLTS